ncbi:unnamed protein product [Sphagnum jensenii]|jgi:hypothetical protein|uniref:Uncharacterized protein n=1 Tax=Sphagnum jensenii TaxID=128206 RepID=A0ABP0WUC8_9BRYO
MAAKEEKRGGATEEEKRKTEVVQAEVARMKQLPPNSAYATHRLRVLDKMQQLLSKARTQAEADELEILFANMSF